MLVLTRKLMEKLFIGDDICVTVVRLEGGQVRLGIEAPREITVVRAELVPDRQPHAPHRPSERLPGLSPTPHSNPSAAAKGAGAAPRGDVRIPQASAHEIGSRRRGRSR